MTRPYALSEYPHYWPLHVITNMTVSSPNIPPLCSRKQTQVVTGVDKEEVWLVIHNIIQGDRVFCTSENWTVGCIHGVHSIHEAVFDIGDGAAPFSRIRNLKSSH